MTSTAQQKMEATLKRVGISAKEIRVYGSQIMVTTMSLDAANKWVGVLSKFSTVRKPVAGKAYTKDSESILREMHRANPGLVRSAPVTHDVWRVWATV